MGSAQASPREGEPELLKPGAERARWLRKANCGRELDGLKQARRGELAIVAEERNAFREQLGNGAREELGRVG